MLRNIICIGCQKKNLYIKKKMSSSRNLMCEKKRHFRCWNQIQLKQFMQFQVYISNFDLLSMCALAVIYIW